MLSDIPLGGVPVTPRVTEIFCGEFEAPEDVTVTFPV
jgi:hypothetical protein